MASRKRPQPQYSPPHRMPEQGMSRSQNVTHPNFAQVTEELDTSYTCISCDYRIENPREGDRCPICYNPVPIRESQLQKCPLCDYPATGPENLESHIEGIHRNINRNDAIFQFCLRWDPKGYYECPFCAKGRTRMDDSRMLCGHMGLHHVDKVRELYDQLQYLHIVLNQSFVEVHNAFLCPFGCPETHRSLEPFKVHLQLEHKANYIQLISDLKLTQLLEQKYGLKTAPEQFPRQHWPGVTEEDLTAIKQKEHLDKWTPVKKRGEKVVKKVVKVAMPPNRIVVAGVRGRPLKRKKPITSGLRVIRRADEGPPVLTPEGSPTADRNIEPGQETLNQQNESSPAGASDAPETCQQSCSFCDYPLLDPKEGGRCPICYNPISTKGANAHKCPLCDYPTTGPAHLESHIEGIHRSISEQDAVFQFCLRWDPKGYYQCPFCLKGMICLTDSRILGEHMGLHAIRILELKTELQFLHEVLNRSFDTASKSFVCPFGCAGTHKCMEPFKVHLQLLHKPSYIDLISVLELSQLLQLKYGLRAAPEELPSHQWPGVSQADIAAIRNQKRKAKWTPLRKPEVAKARGPYRLAPIRKNPSPRPKPKGFWIMSPDGKRKRIQHPDQLFGSPPETSEGDSNTGNSSLRSEEHGGLTKKGTSESPSVTPVKRRSARKKM